MVIALNKISGILEKFVAQEGILRLFVRVENAYIHALLLEDSKFMESFLDKPIEVGFKESNLVVSTALDGVDNAFKAEILGMQSDKLFARLHLKSPFLSSIYALCPRDFVERNALKIGDCVYWHILESEVMLFFKAENG